MRKTVSLSPGKWIWYPSGRTLINTFVLFRREFQLANLPKSAQGWIAADSRYEIYLNGQRVQWGPAPSDPMHEEADPVDLLPYLKPGKNVLAVKVLFYGIGEGTWVAGKPGLLYRIDMEYPGQTTLLVSDEKTICTVDYGHRPGQFQRWYLRALQEEFDNRKAELNWAESEFCPGTHWKPALVVGEQGDRPSVYNQYYEYTSGGLQPQSDDGRLYAREISMPQESEVPVRSLVEAGKIRWKISPDDWFLFRSPDCYEAQYHSEICRKEGAEYAVQAPEGGKLFSDL